MLGGIMELFTRLSREIRRARIFTFRGTEDVCHLARRAQRSTPFKDRMVRINCTYPYCPHAWKEMDIHFVKVANIQNLVLNVAIAETSSTALPI